MKFKANKRVVSAILQQTSSGSVTIGELRSAVHLDSSVLDHDLKILVEASLVSLVGDAIHLSLNQRIRLAIEALSLGCSLKDVCRSLSWVEFEDFCLEALHANGFQVRKHFRFKAGGRGWEIDLVAWCASKMMLIDCKQWNRGNQYSLLRKAAERNLACTEAFLTILPEVSERLGVHGPYSLSVVPVVLTLLQSPVQIHLGVPIVSISQFNGFIYELPEYMSRLAVFPVHLKGC